jgi:hypothetical protein
MSSDLEFKTHMILQTFKENSSPELHEFKNIKEIERYLEKKIPYSALINIYYICSNKGGGLSKKEHKKHIHRKYIELLKKIRIFDINNKELIDNEEYFNKLLIKN